MQSACDDSNVMEHLSSPAQIDWDWFKLGKLFRPRGGRYQWSGHKEIPWKQRSQAQDEETDSNQAAPVIGRHNGRLQEENLNAGNWQATTGSLLAFNHWWKIKEYNFTPVLSVIREDDKIMHILPNTEVNCPVPL